MPLHPDRARAAIEEKIARPLFGGDVLAAAAGIRQVIDSQMADLIRKSTIERGHDPADFVMMAYGGAGPVHAASYGVEAGVAEIIVPFHATVHSAYGAARSDVRFSLTHSEPLVLPAPAERLERIYATMEAAQALQLDGADVPQAQRRFHRWVEARFRRQVHHVRVPVPAALDDQKVQGVARAFEQEYERLFGRGTGLADAGIELVNFGIDAVGVVEQPPESTHPTGAQPAPLGERPVWCPRRRAMLPTPVYDGLALQPGNTIAGPAVIEHPGTTIVVLDGQTARIDPYRHTHILPAPSKGRTSHA
jgi:N-methylhydantoinase A